MKSAEMEALNIVVPLGRGQYFNDDGYVDSIKNHSQILMERYVNKRVDVLTQDVFGHCLSCKCENVGNFLNGDGTYVHIYYLKIPNSNGDIFNRAHEETHALHRLGKLKYLFLDMTKNNCVPPIKLLIKKRIEDVCDVAGIYALKKRDMLPT